MQPIPTPHLLDPDRVLDNDRGDFTADHEARAALLDKALHETCAYAQQLWDTTNALRAYLLDSLPPDPRSPEGHLRAGASPTGPGDAHGWESWIAAFSSATSVLCGPHGDSGYGLGEARHAAELRRSAPNLNLVADHPTLGEPVRPDDDAKPETSDRTPRPGNGPATGPSKPLKLLAAGVVGVLALRGLRRR
jgi:hypothetical protein